MPIFTGRIKRPSYNITVAHGASVTTAQITDTLNGILREAVITPPAAVDGAATISFSLKDLDGNIVYTKSGLAANSGASINLLTNDLRVPLSGAYTLLITYSASQTATDSTTKVVLYVET